MNCELTSSPDHSPVCILVDSQVGSDDEYADIDWDAMEFGLTPTDYMYTTKCTQQEDGFPQGQLNRYGNLELSPAAGVLNYGQVSELYNSIYVSLYSIINTIHMNKYARKITVMFSCFQRAYLKE